MKKIIAAVVVVLLLLLVVAPWGVGQLAEKRIDAGLAQLQQQAPYITVVESKWTRGWFRSEQEVTFELFSSMLRGVNQAVYGYESLRKADVPIDTEPSFAFHPGLPDRKPVKGPQRFTTTISSARTSASSVGSKKPFGRLPIVV